MEQEWDVMVVQFLCEEIGESRGVKGGRNKFPSVIIVAQSKCFSLFNFYSFIFLDFGIECDNTKMLNGSGNTNLIFHQF